VAEGSSPGGFAGGERAVRIEGLASEDWDRIERTVGPPSRFALWWATFARDRQAKVGGSHEAERLHRFVADSE
jgi:hypothetical protein